MALESMKAASALKQDGINAEIVDLRTIKPLDTELILESVKKTGRAIIVDGGWKTYGISAEISALIGENLFGQLEAPVVRVTLPDVPAPASKVLEDAYYPTSTTIINAAKKLIA
jgi:acetoin:2,6-dichlorophenolindophenol oxidoreductase subunit beta